jgi:hypothetical protein
MSDAARAGFPGALAPVAVGIATALFVAWIWGSLAEPPTIHDEAAYRLQAEIFASGQISAEPPPLPEFFEQSHVLVTPRLAPKYPPGHALLLVPGVWLGVPGLVPVLLAGVSGALLFALARSVSGLPVAWLAWLIWLGAPAGNLWRATYLSESTSTALWLGSAWLLLRWWRTGSAAALIGIALLTGWMGLTRPLTAIGFALPLGVLVLFGVGRRGAWGSLAAAGVAGVLVLGAIPIWNAGSTLDWRVTPYSEYSRVYTPFQKLGFGVDPQPAVRALPPDLAASDAAYRRIHGAHEIRALPRAFVGRLYAASAEVWGGPTWRRVLALFMVVGLFFLPAAGRFAGVWTLSLFVAYLAYAHPLDWLVYYYEAHAFFAYAAALGVWVLLVRLAAARAERIAFAVAAVIALLGVRDARATRVEIEKRGAYHRAFAQVVAAIPESKAVLFVRYGPDHDPNFSLVANTADPADARVWIVHDRGADDARLLALAPDRVPYYFDEAGFKLYRLAPPP